MILFETLSFRVVDDAIFCCDHSGLVDILNGIMDFVVTITMLRNHKKNSLKDVRKCNFSPSLKNLGLVEYFCFRLHGGFGSPQSVSQSENRA